MTSASTVSDELIKIPMSDGVVLEARMYRSGTGRRPATLMMTPYGKDVLGPSNAAQTIAAAGFICIVADVRGFGGSPGPYEGLLSEREIEDGVDAIEWIASQPFCDGSVGLVGGSYCGINQMLIAARRPAALRCISPVIAGVDTYRDWTRRGGMPSILNWGVLAYLEAAYAHPETARMGMQEYHSDLLMDPLDNERHRRRSPEYVLDQIEVPAFVAGGWDDFFARGSVRSFEKIRTPKRLVMGPWCHFNAWLPIEQSVLRWLAFWLRGEGDDPTESQVKLHRSGTEEWAAPSEWPSLNSSQVFDWSICNEDRRVEVVPTMRLVLPAPNPRPLLAFDPFMAGFSLWGELAAFDSEPFAEDTILEGPGVLNLRVTPHGCSDCQVHARVSVVATDGTVTQLREGRLLASHRAIDPQRTIFFADGSPAVPWHPHDRADPLPVDEPSDVSVEMMPMSHMFRKGERLRVGLSFARADGGLEPAAATIGAGSRITYAQSA